MTADLRACATILDTVDLFGMDINDPELALLDDNALWDAVYKDEDGKEDELEEGEIREDSTVRTAACSTSKNIRI